MSIANSLLIVLVLCNGSVAQARRRTHPSVYVDKGACPFECCVYREWSVDRDTRVYSQPRSDARAIATLKKGAKVRALTGFVRTVAGRFRVKKDHGRYHAGDTIWVYTYHGEGYFTIWYNGRMYKESLDFSPYGGGTGTRCADDTYCFGELDADLQMTWWIKLRLPDGRIAWTRQSDHFGNMDACG